MKDVSDRIATLKGYKVLDFTFKNVLLEILTKLNGNIVELNGKIEVIEKKSKDLEALIHAGI